MSKILWDKSRFLLRFKSDNEQVEIRNIRTANLHTVFVLLLIPWVGCTVFVGLFTSSIYTTQQRFV